MLVFAFAITTLSAQTETEKSSKNEFNQWSVELGAGLNKVQKPMTAGYGASIKESFVLDLGARYMFNNKFGLKGDFGYNHISGNNFDSNYYRVDAQVVSNLGRMMNFESWTQKIGLLGHSGVGLSLLKSKNTSIKDGMINFMAGITGQFKLTDKVVLTGDFTSIFNAKQNYAFDGMGPAGSAGFNGTVFNGTIGVTVYLGKKAKHADWVIDNEVELLNNRITLLESKLLDSDNDGVVDYLDIEPDTMAGAMVDSKGKSTDLNGNNIPDDIEEYLLKNYTNKADQSPILSDNDLIKSMINGGFVAAYFDFGKSTPTNVSADGIDFILTYLRKNPTDSIDIIGHTDELGKTEYNDKLSNARANSIKKVLEAAKIDSSRLNVIAAGEDSSVDKNSESARKLVRKVTFVVK
jgi:outer membrane protein OmpA-like peptidoglycan-associated protein